LFSLHWPEPSTWSMLSSTVYYGSWLTFEFIEFTLLTGGSEDSQCGGLSTHGGFCQAPSARPTAGRLEFHVASSWRIPPICMGLLRNHDQARVFVQHTTCAVILHIPCSIHQSSSIMHHTSYFIHHTPYFIHHTSYIIRQPSSIILHTSYAVIHHPPIHTHIMYRTTYIIHRASYIAHHIPSIIHHTSYITHPTSSFVA